MLQKSLRLVGLAVALAIVGVSGSWTVQADEGVTLDPGTVVTADTAQQSLLAEALAAMIRTGYNPRDFDFERAVFDPLWRAVFLPLRNMPQKLGESPTFAGLVYVREPLTWQDQTLENGLHPLTLHVSETPYRSNSKPSEHRRSTTLSQDDITLRVTCGIDIFSGKPSCTVGFTVSVPVPPPPGIVPPGGGGTSGDCSAEGGFFNLLECFFGRLLDPII